MNKIIKFILVLFFLGACGFKPIFSGKKVDFGINSLKYDENKIVEFLINKNLNNYKETKNKNKIYEVEILSKKNKITISKDERGAPKSFRTEIYVNFKILKNEELISSKDFYKSQDYNNNENKFDLNRYEENIENNILSKLNERIIIYLYSL